MPDNLLDYFDEDFDPNCSGFYRVWYRRTRKPDGPHWSIKDLAKATKLTDYPSDGYIVYFYEAGEISSVPSLNPDDLYKGRFPRLRTVWLIVTRQHEVYQ